MADIDVVIGTNAATTSSDMFGKVLIICTNKDHAYTEYDVSNDLTLLASDFASSTTVYDLADIFTQQVPRPKTIAVFGKDLTASSTKPADLTTALNTLITSENDWYRICLDDQTEALITAVSTWTESNKKMFYTQFSNTTFTTDFTAKDRTVLAYKADSDRLDIAMLGEAVTRVPGSFGWKYRNLIGVTADHIDTTTQATILGKNMNMYLTKFKQNQQATDCMNSGLVASGKHIDQIESRDWVQNRITQEIAKLLINTEKVPYDDTGIQLVVKAIQNALDDATANSIIAKKNGSSAGDYSITYPKVADISTTYKTQRKLVGISFQYVELPSIETVTVTGTVVAQL